MRAKVAHIASPVVEHVAAVLRDRTALPSPAKGKRHGAGWKRCCRSHAAGLKGRTNGAWPLPFKRGPTSLQRGRVYCSRRARAFAAASVASPTALGWLSHTGRSRELRLRAERAWPTRYQAVVLRHCWSGAADRSRRWARQVLCRLPMPRKKADREVKTARDTH